MKLLGFCIWKNPEGEPYVTFPSRAFGAGEERRYFDYIRSTNGTAEPVKKLKAWILEEYRRSRGRNSGLGGPVQRSQKRGHPFRP